VSDSQNSGYQLRGLDRALDVLDCLAERPGSMAEVVERMELSWGSAYRLFKSLEARGWLVQDDSGAYRLGPAAFYVGSTYLEWHPVVRVGRSQCREAAERAHATAQIAEMRRGRSVVLVSYDHQSATFRPRTTSGYHYPLHCGAKGIVLLAHAAPEYQAEYLQLELESLTPKTLVDPILLAAKLEEVRDVGYCFTAGDIQSSSASVAAPIRDRKGAVCASVCLIGDVNEFMERESDLASIIVALAESISASLGWSPARGSRS
jgi:DNA-binding IclR family transcriptional regulator